MDNSINSSTLLSYQPGYYKGSIVINNINNANAIELNSFNTMIENVLNQFFISSADTSLGRWEKEFGININNNRTLSERISRVLAKIRGQGTTTEEIIKEIIKSWTNSEVEILESSTYSSLNSFTHEELKSKTYDDLKGEYYEIKIFFIDSIGIPSQMQDVYNAINIVIPAHLNIRYIFKYLAYQALAYKTHLYLSNYSHDEITNNKI